MSVDDWETVKVGEIVRQEKRSITLIDDRDYQRLTIKSRGQGVEPRDVLSGAHIKTKRQFLVRTNDFLVAEIDAKVGGFGVAPGSCDGAIVSSHYFVFAPDVSRVMPQWLDLLCRRGHFTAQVEAQGSTNYAAIRPAQVLEYTLPLPSFEEQGYIVEAVAAAQDIGFACRAEGAALLNLACSTYVTEVEAGRFEEMSLGDFLTLSLQKIQVDPEETYRIAGLIIAGGGLFDRGTIVGADTNYPHLFRLGPDQLVYRKLTAWEGPITVVTPEFVGCHISSEFPTFDIDKAKVAPGFMRFVATRPWFHDEMKQRATGTAERRNRLKPADLLEIEISVPRPHIQDAVAAIMSQIDLLRAESVLADSTAAGMAESMLEREAA